MDSTIRKMYGADRMVIWIFLAMTWGSLILVLREVLVLAPGATVKAVAAISALTVGAFATSSLLAVLAHLKARRESLYREDLEHQRRMHE